MARQIEGTGRRDRRNLKSKRADCTVRVRGDAGADRSITPRLHVTNTLIMYLVLIRRGGGGQVGRAAGSAQNFKTQHCVQRRLFVAPAGAFTVKIRRHCGDRVEISATLVDRTY